MSALHSPTPTADAVPDSVERALAGRAVDPAAVVAGIDAIEHLLKVARVSACGRNPQDAAAYLAMARDRLDTLIS